MDHRFLHRIAGQKPTWRNPSRRLFVLLVVQKYRRDNAAM